MLVTENILISNGSIQGDPARCSSFVRMPAKSPNVTKASNSPLLKVAAVVISVWASSTVRMDGATQSILGITTPTAGLSPLARWPLAVQ